MIDVCISFSVWKQEQRFKGVNQSIPNLLLTGQEREHNSYHNLSKWQHFIVQDC